jgi:AcrR family transcriptional regulator
MPRTGLTAEEIKDKSIALTIKRMRKEGFDQVRLTDIAKELGVSHAALYSHFKDKTALLDAVSDRWLIQIDEDLASVCRKQKDPVEKIWLWMLTLHRAKVTKVMNDPELYKAFDLSTSVMKPFIQRHMDSMNSQIVDLVNEAIAKRRLRNTDPQMMATILQEATRSFHHPKLVAQQIHEKREPLLRQVVDSVLRGLDLKD